MIEDYHAWAGRAAAFDDTPFRRILGMPLKVRDQVIGVINIVDDQMAGLFSKDEIQLARLFADQAALEIENTRLLQAEREQRVLAEALRDTTRRSTIPSI